MQPAILEPWFWWLIGNLHGCWLWHAMFVEINRACRDPISDRQHGQQTCLQRKKSWNCCTGKCVRLPPSPHTHTIYLVMEIVSHRYIPSCTGSRTINVFRMARLFLANSTTYAESRNAPFYFHVLLYIDNSKYENIIENDGFYIYAGALINTEQFLTPNERQCHAI